MSTLRASVHLKRVGLSMLRISARLGAAALLIACAGVASERAAARDDVPDELKKRSNPVTLEESEIRYYQRQFKGKCARCHAIDGSGTGVDAAASSGLAPPANFRDTDYMASRSDGELFYQILKGGGERCAMPAFGPESDQAWSEDKIWHMVAFVRRFAQPSER
jgi:mono/diheme cytochrome c family protein